MVDPAWDIDGLFNFIDEREYQLTGALRRIITQIIVVGVLATMLSKESPHCLSANRYPSMPMSMKSRGAEGDWRIGDRPQVGLIR